MGGLGAVVGGPAASGEGPGGPHWEHLHSELAGPELGKQQGPCCHPPVRGDPGAFTHSFV